MRRCRCALLKPAAHQICEQPDYYPGRRNSGEILTSGEREGWRSYITLRSDVAHPWQGPFGNKDALTGPATSSKAGPVWA